MFKFFWPTASVLFLFVLPLPTQAQDIKQILSTAQQQIDREEFADAQASLRLAMMAISDRAPLEIDYFDFVTKEAPNFSNITLRADNIFRAGEPLLIYVEPTGYAFQRKGERLRFGVEVDFELLDESGKVLGGQKKFVQRAIEGWDPVFDFYMNLTYSFKGLAPGKYVVRTVLHDIVDKDEAWFELPFEIRK
jgi:hypothetical protein